MTDNKITIPKIEEVIYIEEHGSETEKSTINSQKLIHLETISEISEATRFLQNRYNKWAKKEYEENIITDEFSKFPALFDITGIDFAEEMAKRAIQNGYKEV
jgi:hypothetical protein